MDNNKHDDTSDWYDANIEVEGLPDDFPDLMDIHDEWIKLFLSESKLPDSFFEKKHDTPSAWQYLKWYGDKDSEGE